MGIKDKLYFLPSLGVRNSHNIGSKFTSSFELQIWYVGNQWGVNMGYACHWGTNQCPETLDNTWEWAVDGGWANDPEAKVVCA